MIYKSFSNVVIFFTFINSLFFMHYIIFTLQIHISSLRIICIIIISLMKNINIFFLILNQNYRCHFYDYVQNKESLKNLTAVKLFTKTSQLCNYKKMKINLCIYIFSFKIESEIVIF